MVPKDLLDTLLAELPIGLAKMGYAYIDERCRHIIGGLETETGYGADTARLEELIAKKQELEQKKLDGLEKIEQEKAIVDQMEKLMRQIINNAFSQKTGKKGPTLRDVLKIYLPESMRIYNSDGFEIAL